MIDILKEILKGESLSRALTNIELKNFGIKGKILDIGGQGSLYCWLFADRIYYPNNFQAAFHFVGFCAGLFNVAY